MPGYLETWGIGWTRWDFLWFDFFDFLIYSFFQGKVWEGVPYDIPPKNSIQSLPYMGGIFSLRSVILIGINKYPGVFPVGVGYMCRMLMDNYILTEADSKATESCVMDKLCFRTEGKIEVGIDFRPFLLQHYFQEEYLVFLLIDTWNMFDEENWIFMMWEIW